MIYYSKGNDIMGLFDLFKGKTSISPPKEEKNEPVEAAQTPPADTENETKTAKLALDRVRRKTMKPVLNFELTNVPVSINGSKVGGVPYMPADTEVPTDKNGSPLQFLAQIDCRELSGLPDFPQKGLLQFWIGQDDGLGLFTEGGSRVIWYEDIDETVTEADVRAKLDQLPKSDENFSPVNGEYGISLSQGEEPMPADNAHFPPIFIAEFNKLSMGRKIESMDDLDDSTNEMIWDYTDNSGHKIGGYPMFTQWDPRSENDDRTVLLFQLDSDYSTDSEKVMWGDAGVCGFFCTPSELRKRDLTNVLYNWDCG